MVESDKHRLIISYGKWFVRLDNIYLKGRVINWYKGIENQLSWITNLKMKVYVHARMIKGDSLNGILNGILNGAHLIDPIYQKIEIDNIGSSDN